MKKLESLNNSLYEKFENKRVNNLALITGGSIATQNSGGSDTFYNSAENKKTSAVEMNGTKGDIVQNSVTNPGGSGSGGGGAVGGGTGNG